MRGSFCLRLSGRFHRPVVRPGARSAAGGSIALFGCGSAASHLPEILGRQAAQCFSGKAERLLGLLGVLHFNPPGLFLVSWFDQ